MRDGSFAIPLHTENDRCSRLSNSDAAWSLLTSFTEYKAEGAGRLFAQVNPNGTSQMCSGCGVKVEKTLSERIHNCTNCGLQIDRDLNAAINILRLGLQSLGVPLAQTMEAASF
ncbi:MAG: transposase [Acidobacteriota bacterium]